MAPQHYNALSFFRVLKPTRPMDLYYQALVVQRISFQPTKWAGRNYWNHSFLERDHKNFTVY